MASRNIEAAVDAPEMILVGEPLPVRVWFRDAYRAAARIAVRNEAGHLVDIRTITPPVTTNVEGLPPGVYTIAVTGLDAASAISPVTITVLVWQADAE